MKARWRIVCLMAVRYGVETDKDWGSIMPTTTTGVRIIPFVIAAACLAAAPGRALADTPRSAASGSKLAQQYCSRCHQVSPSGRRGWTDAPSFESIGNRPGSTTETLSATIQQPHMKMLNTGRPVAEANDIAAYIMSLRKQ
jgi:mono/diheme cytochrome c family protein